MNIARRILIPVSLMAALWFTAGCDGFKPLFDDVNLDPHPPVITSLQSTPGEIFTPGIIRGTLTYVDTGGDIEELSMSDLDSSADLSPTAPFDEDANEEQLPLFFPGTSGTVEWQVTLDTDVAGLHRIKVWLVDSKESWSEPDFFEVIVKF